MTIFKLHPVGPLWHLRINGSLYMTDADPRELRPVITKLSRPGDRYTQYDDDGSKVYDEPIEDWWAGFVSQATEKRAEWADWLRQKQQWQDGWSTLQKIMGWQ